MVDAYKKLSKEELIKELIAERKVHEQISSSHNSLQKDFQKLQFELDQLKRMIFGSKSERFVGNENPAQLSLLDVEPKTEDPKKVVVPSHERKKHDAKNLHAIFFLITWSAW